MSIDCKYLTSFQTDDGPKYQCKLAGQLSGGVRPYTSLELCKACMGCESPASPDSPIVQHLQETAKMQQKMIDVTNRDNKLGEGPGTELHNMIPEFLEHKGCSCRDYAKKMNIWGPDGCEKNREKIIERLISESNKRPMFGWLPDKMVRVVADKMVTTAIKRARDKESNSAKWFVAVTTSPRSIPTLNTCLDSLVIAGFRPYIFAEPGVENIGSAHRDRIINNERRLGVWHNWVSSARYAIENSDAEIIMTVQDDSLFHPDSKELTEKFLWPQEDVGFVSLYTPKHYTDRPHKKGGIRPTGLNRIHTKSLWGACALAWPRKVLEEVLQHKLIETWLGAPIKTKSAWPARRERRKKEPWTIQNSDTAIGKIMNSMNRTMWFLDPSPVNHFAKTSTTGHGGNDGRRNCSRCAKFSVPLEQQIPFLRNGYEFEKIGYDQIII